MEQFFGVYDEMCKNEKEKNIPGGNIFDQHKTKILIILIHQSHSNM